MEQDDFINIDLEAVPTGSKPIYETEGVHPVRVVHRERKQKSEAGSYPYYELQLQPLDITNDKRRLFVNLSTAPNALWHTRAFVEAAGLPLKGFKVEMLDNCELLVTVGLEPAFNNPEEKRNVVKPPYHPFK